MYQYRIRPDQLFSQSLKLEVILEADFGKVNYWEEKSFLENFQALDPFSC
jgi:hypothetical protein